METTKIIFGFSFIALFTIRILINSLLYNKLRKTDHNIFYLVPWEKGALTHGLESVMTFNWTIKKDYKKGVKQTMILSNWMSIICGILLGLFIMIGIIEQIKT